MKFTVFKIPNHRQFNYSPLYYDEAREERKERERNIRKEMGLTPLEDEKVPSISDRIRGKMNRRIKTNFEVTRKVRKTSNIRLVIILFALFALFYYLLMASHEWFARFF